MKKLPCGGCSEGSICEKLNAMCPAMCSLIGSLIISSLSSSIAWLNMVSKISFPDKGIFCHIYYIPIQALKASCLGWVMETNPFVTIMIWNY